MSTTFHDLTISKISKEASKTVAITFSIPSELTSHYNFESGQYLTLRAMVNGEDIRRSYSICSAPHENEVTVAVKAIENGKFSNYAYDTLKEGDTLAVMPPMGNFTIKGLRDTKNHVFFAAGSGITPVLSMIKSILKSGTNSNVYLVYGNRTANDTIFKSQLDSLASSHSNFSLTYIFSREEGTSAISNGRITGPKCAELGDSVLSGVAIDEVYVCGPEQMINAVKEFYSSKGMDKGKIHFELFTTPSIEQVSKPLVAGAVIKSSVTVIIDDEEYSFDLASNGKDILQAAQDMGADVPFSCKGGVCCTCRAKIIEGSATMDMNFALEESEIEEGFVLTCQAHPTSERIVVSFDEY